jgi:hypothetical protein
MSLNENLFLALIFFANLFQQKNKILLNLKLPTTMKKLHSNLAVVKSTVTVFENSKQEGKQGTGSSKVCIFL